MLYVLCTAEALFIEVLEKLFLLLNEFKVLVHIRLKEKNSKRPIRFCAVVLLDLTPPPPAIVSTLLPNLSSSLSSLCVAGGPSMPANGRWDCSQRKTTEKSVGLNIYFLISSQALGLHSMVQLAIKTPNPKCCLYWCSIELIDWRFSQSCWYFRPALLTL